MMHAVIFVLFLFLSSGCSTVCCCCSLFPVYSLFSAGGHFLVFRFIHSCCLYCYLFVGFVWFKARIEPCTERCVTSSSLLGIGRRWQRWRQMIMRLRMTNRFSSSRDTMMRMTDYPVGSPVLLAVELFFFFFFFCLFFFLSVGQQCYPFISLLSHCCFYLNSSLYLSSPFLPVLSSYTVFNPFSRFAWCLIAWFWEKEERQKKGWSQLPCDTQ